MMKFNNSKPLIVGGLPRSGTTALTRFVYRQLLIESDNPPGYCDELFRILPSVYEINWLDKPRMISLANKSKDALVLDVENVDATDFMFPVAGNNISTTLPYIKARVDSYKRYNFSDYFGKVFPMDLDMIKLIDQNYTKDLLLNHHWLICWREDWFELLISILYAINTKQFHVYGQQSFIEKHILLHPLQIDQDIHNIFGLFYKWISKDMDMTLISLDDIKNIPNNWNETPKDKVPTDWLVPPVVVDGKKKKMEELVLNYDIVKKRAFKRIGPMLSKYNGLFVLSEDKEKIHIDLTKLREKCILC